MSKLGSSTHAFDLEAEVEPIPNLEDEEDDGGGGVELGMDADDFNPDTVDNDDAGMLRYKHYPRSRTVLKNATHT